MSSIDYAEVPPEQVPLWMRELAGKVLALVSREMLAREKVPPPEIQWVRIASLTTTGFMRPAMPDTIYLSATLTKEELVRALVHEVVHIVQARTTGTTELSEWAAEGVAAVYVRRLVLEGEDPAA